MIVSEKIIKRFPLFATILIELNSVQQIIVMIRNHSSKDQSITGWLLIIAALFMWFIFYKIFNKEHKITIYSTIASIIINIIVVLIILYYR